MSLETLRRNHAGIGELFRFGLVGTAGFVFDIAVLRLYILTVGDLFRTGDAPFCGQAVAWFFAATFTWWLNRQFTFRNHERPYPLRQWVQFLVVNASGGLANYAVYALLVAFVAFFHAWPAAAVAIGTLVGLIFNFTGSRKLVFKRQG
jgi:putative flippase GtrA